MTVNGYLFAAYTAVWTILFIYLFFLSRKQKETAEELEEIAETLSRGHSTD